MEAAGNSTVHEIRAVDSSISIKAGENNTFYNVITKGSALTLEATNGLLGMREEPHIDGSISGGTDCGEYGQRVFILLDEGDTNDTASVSLSGASIGTEDNRLIVDIPEAVTLKIPVVGDLYIDSLELIPQKAAVDADGDGTPDTDEDGNVIWAETGTEDGIVYVDVHITADDLGFNLTRADHPDNPQVNEYTAPEMDPETGKPGDDVTGDHLDHIKDETHTGDLPFQTNEEIAQRIVATYGDDWAELLDAEQIKQILADETVRDAVLENLSDEEIQTILKKFRTDENPVSDADKNLTEQIISSGDESWKEVLKQILSDRIDEIAKADDAGVITPDVTKLTDEEILAILNGYTPAEEDADTYRQTQFDQISSLAANEAAAEARVTALNESLPDEGKLTDEKIAELKDALLNNTEAPEWLTDDNIGTLLAALRTDEYPASAADKALAEQIIGNGRGQNEGWKEALESGSRRQNR